MTEVIVDVSLAFKWAVREHDSTVARRLLRTWNRGHIDIRVPSWFACELANAFHQQVRRGRLSTRLATWHLESVLRRVSLLDPDPKIAVRGLEIASLLKQSASYDSQYVALAEHLGCELWTADARFGRVAQAVFPFVHWLGEPAPPTGTGQAGP